MAIVNVPDLVVLANWSASWWHVLCAKPNQRQISAAVPWSTSGRGVHSHKRLEMDPAKNN
jgi:hypothetical protein